MCRELTNLSDFSYSHRARHNDSTKQLGVFVHLFYLSKSIIFTIM